MRLGLQKISQMENMDSLRGVEGQLAERYFSVFDHLIINQKEDFVFKTRSRRPPLDRVNALLSFCYTVLANDCANALKSVGLDVPQVTELAYELKQAGVDLPDGILTMDELMEKLLPILHEKFPEVK